MELVQPLLQQILDDYGPNHYYYGIRKLKLENQLIEHTTFLDTNVLMKERFYCILNRITRKAKCKRISCNNTPEFKNIVLGYLDFCSSKCVEIFKRETFENVELISKTIGNKIRKDKKKIENNGKTKGQNARQKQLEKQLVIDDISGLKITSLIAKKGVDTLVRKNELKLRGQKIKYLKENNFDEFGNNGYMRASVSMSKTKKRQFQQLQIDNALNSKNYFLYFSINQQNDIVKIGVSKDFDKRKKYLENKLKQELTIFSVYFGIHVDILKTEFKLHESLSDGQVIFSNIDGKQNGLI